VGRLDKTDSMEELKIHTKFLFATLKGRGSLEGIGLDEMLKNM
jgi:hypothetical protein